MAHIATDRFKGKTQKVKLLIDQKINGIACKKGDTTDLPVHEAHFLKNIDRVEYVGASPVDARAIVTR